jgi:VanZ family protein
MKKVNKKIVECPICDNLGKKMAEFKNKIQAKTQETKKYAKENPEKTKKFLTIGGAFLLGILAFLMGRKSKNKK